MSDTPITDRAAMLGRTEVIPADKARELERMCEELAEDLQYAIDKLESNDIAGYAYEDTLAKWKAMKEKAK